MNNNSNNCGDCGTTCSECGRPWAICKQDGGCGCNKCKDIKFCEYGRMANGCIREKQPGCPMQAVIPSVTVESIEGIKNLADCLVHVSDINTTFYIDDKHRPIITWAGPIDIPGYDMEGNPNNYRDQIVTDVANQMAVIYDKSGKGYLFGLAENIDLQEQVNNKLDEMAENGTLAEIINNYDKCQFIFPKNWKNVSSSDANLIINQGKSLMIDVSYADTYGRVVDMLNDNGVTHLDYVVITHWDNDHIGNLKNLIANNIIDSDTDVYMPLAPSFVSAETVTEYQTYFAGYNIEYKTPTNLATIDVGNLKVTFGNCDLVQDEQYASLPDRRNLISTVLLIEHKDIKAFYSGDADNQAYEYLYNTGFIKGAVDLFKIGHHGFNITTFAPFLKICSPKYSVQTGSDKDFNEGNFAFSPSINTLAEQGSKIYPTYMNEDYLEFVSDGYNIHVVNGNPLSSSLYIEDNTDIYVDISTQNPDGDGSQEKPYKDIGSAFGSVNNYNTRVVSIRLANGSYGLSDATAGNRKSSVWIENAKPTIRIIGNSEDRTSVTINGSLFVNSKVSLEHLTINCKYRHGVYLRNNSVGVINDCLLTSDEMSTYDGVVADTSKVSIKNSKIENVVNAITGTNACNIGIHDTEFGAVTTKFNLDESCNLLTEDLSNTDLSPNLFEYTNYNKTMLLYRGDGSLNNNYTISEIELPVSFSELTDIEITLKSNTNRYVNSGKIYYPTNGMIIPIVAVLGSPTYMYYMMTEVLLSNDNKLTFQAQYRMRINRSTGAIDYTDYPSNGNYYFKFINVRGGKDGFNLLVGENE